MGSTNHSSQLHSSSTTVAQIQENLGLCYSLAVRILADSELAEEAVLDAVRRVGTVEDQIEPEETGQSEAIRRIVQACFRVAAKHSETMSPRHPARSDAHDPAALLICGMSALPLEGRMIVELYDRQQMAVDDIARMLGMQPRRVRQMLHSCRIFLLEYFQIAQNNRQ